MLTLTWHSVPYPEKALRQRSACVGSGESDWHTRWPSGICQSGLVAWPRPIVSFPGILFLNFQAGGRCWPVGSQSWAGLNCSCQWPPSLPCGVIGRSQAEPREEGGGQGRRRREIWPSCLRSWTQACLKPVPLLDFPLTGVDTLPLFLQSNLVTFL